MPALTCQITGVAHGDDVPAIALAPQIVRGPQRIAYATMHFVPVCAHHLDGWWEGSDIPESERPANVSLTAPEEFYVVDITGGTEIGLDGPHATACLRDERARELWAGKDAVEGDQVFWLDLNRMTPGFDRPGPVAGEYLEGELGDDEE